MTLSVKQICNRFGVGEHTVLHWINSGQLRAQNVSRDPGGRLKWRVTEEALVAFESARSTSPAPAPSRRQRKARGEVLEFIK